MNYEWLVVLLALSSSHKINDARLEAGLYLVVYKCHSDPKGEELL